MLNAFLLPLVIGFLVALAVKALPEPLRLLGFDLWVLIGISAIVIAVVFYGRRGRINARELWEQMMNTCSRLNLILACIVYWQACEIPRVLSECDPLANRIDLCLLEHVSPIEQDNVVLYGEYILDRKPRPPAPSRKKGRP